MKAKSGPPRTTRTRRTRAKELANRHFYKTLLESFAIFILAAFLPVLPQFSLPYLLFGLVFGLTALTILWVPRLANELHFRALLAFCESWLFLLLGLRLAFLVFPTALQMAWLCVAVWCLLVALARFAPALAEWLASKLEYMYSVRFFVAHAFVLSMVVRYAVYSYQEPSPGLVVAYKLSSLALLFTGIAIAQVSSVRFWHERVKSGA